MTCYALLTVSFRTGPLGWGRGLGVKPPGAASWAGSPEGVGNGLGGCTWPLQITSSYRFGGCFTLAAREEVTSPPSLLNPEGSWFRLPPHLAWHEWSFSPPGTASSSPHSSAALTNTVFHTVFLPLHFPSPPSAPCLSSMAFDPGWFPSPLRG